MKWESNASDVVRELLPCRKAKGRRTAVDTRDFDTLDVTHLGRSLVLLSWIRIRDACDVTTFYPNNIDEHGSSATA